MEAGVRQPRPVEYAKPGSQPALGSIQVLPGSTAPNLCAQFAAAQGPDWPELQGEIAGDAVAWTRVPTQDYWLAEALVDIAPSVRRKLIFLQGETHFFDGALLFLAPVSADARQLDPERMLKAEEAQGLPEGWQVISGGQPTLYPDVSLRYVHFADQKIDGRLYFLAWPTNREVHPTAILVEPTPSGFKAVCSFQRVEPNF